MKAMVKEDVCIGCELCAQTCPEVFEMRGDVAVATVDSVPSGQEDGARQAAEDCPVEAIVIEE